MAESRQRNCVNEIDFYREIEELKGHLKTKDSQENVIYKMIFTTRPNILPLAPPEARIDPSRNN